MVSSEMENCLSSIIQANLLRKLFNQPPIKSPKDVCRNLFGVAKSSNVLQMIQEMDKRVERSSQEWNFDFNTEVPMPPGRYLWEKVKNCDLPAWYSVENPKVVHKEKHPQLITDSGGRTDVAVPRGDARGEKENSKFDLRLNVMVEESHKSTKCLRQTSMKDFSRVQKRRCSKRLRLKKLDQQLLEQSCGITCQRRREGSLVKS